MKHDPFLPQLEEQGPLIELAKALARAAVARDIAAARKDPTGANAPLRPL